MLTERGRYQSDDAPTRQSHNTRERILNSRTHRLFLSIALLALVSPTTSTRQLVFGLQRLGCVLRRHSTDSRHVPAPDVLVGYRHHRPVSDSPFFKYSSNHYNRLDPPTIASSSIWRAISMFKLSAISLLSKETDKKAVIKYCSVIGALFVRNLTNF